MGGPGSGRTPAPTELKILQGVQETRINRATPKPPAGEVVPPYELSEPVLEVWDRLLDTAPKGLITPHDADALAAFCEAIVGLRAAFRGTGKISDYAPVCTSLGARFGWTPSDRSKIVMPEGGKNEKPRGGDLLTG